MKDHCDLMLPILLQPSLVPSSSSSSYQGVPNSQGATNSSGAGDTADREGKAHDI